mgnify:CR=1 FL=1
MFTPLTALILIKPEAISESSFEYMGAPNPAGIPLALISITVQHEDPDYLTNNFYCYNSSLLY